MNFKQYLNENTEFDYDEFEDSVNSDGDWIEDLESDDDQFAVYTDEEDDLVFEEAICEECGLAECDCEDGDLVTERLKKVKVIRNGKKQIKWKSDREGYKIVRDGKRAKEVKMSPQEKLQRSKQQKRGARKRKRTSSQSARKRKRSISRRTF